MPHPLVDQLRFTRSEFKRALEGLSTDDAARRFLSLNCIAWNVGHLGWHEQRYFITYPSGKVLLPELNERFTYGAPASTPNLDEVLAAWKKITKAADPWLDTLTTTKLTEQVIRDGKPIDRFWGNLLQRVIYHYWYYTGENSAIRQNLGHTDLPQFVGNIDSRAPYRPERCTSLSMTNSPLIGANMTNNDFLHRIETAQKGTNPNVICHVPSGWVVLAEMQYLRGYCILLADPVVELINVLKPQARVQFTDDMCVIGDALLAVTNSFRINYGMFSNSDPYLHAHIIPRYKDEPEEFRRNQPWSYSKEYMAAAPFDPERDRDLILDLANAIQKRL